LASVFKKIKNEYTPLGPVSAIPDIIITSREKCPCKFIIATDGLLDAHKNSQDLIDKFLKYDCDIDRLGYRASDRNGDDDITILYGSV